MNWNVRILMRYGSKVRVSLDANIRRYLCNVWSVFNKEDFWSKAQFIDAAKTFAWWFVPAFAAALVFERDKVDCAHSYLCRAVEQGISPELWNVLGCFGAVLLGLAALLPSSRMLATMANQVLANTYSIGCLSLGTVVGKAAQSLVDTNIMAWRDLLGGVNLVLLVVILTAMNVSVWYMSFLAGYDERPSPILRKWSSLGLMTRLPVALLLIFLPIYTLSKSH